MFLMLMVYLLLVSATLQDSPAVNAATFSTNNRSQAFLTTRSLSAQCEGVQESINSILKHGGCRPILVQQHVDGSRFFDRTWNEFKVGFSSSYGNYWIGNELLHELTKYGQYLLRFDLQSLDNQQWYWAEYSSVYVDSEANGYRIQLGSFTGNVYRDAMRYVNGMVTYQNNMKFTTKDRDHDTGSGYSCAVLNAGGFWYSNCARASVNSAHGFSAEDFSWWDLTSSGLRRLKQTQMWLKCR